MVINYNLNAGNATKDLITQQAHGSDIIFQINYSAIVASTVKIAVGISAKSAGPFVDIPDAALTIDPAKTSDIIALNGFGWSYVKLTLVSNGVTVGLIESIDVIQS